MVLKSVLGHAGSLPSAVGPTLSQWDGSLMDSSFIPPSMMMGGLKFACLAGDLPRGPKLLQRDGIV